ncbi:MAG: DUF2184 domain-containing protein [Deltaproteobacteria bacterium]|jgi:hypothetical protein|nr:DUF2184 domain-containing protein [Deltaproteobacteria bacterium]
MTVQQTLKVLAAKGIHIPGARGFIRSDRSNVGALAQDAALQTAASASVPGEFRLYLAEDVIDILTAPTVATELLSEACPAGVDETTVIIKYPIAEKVGRTKPYDDFAHHGTADVNREYRVREQYVFQTTIAYGEMETKVSSAAKINLVAEKQAAAAETLKQDANRFYMYGVKGRNIYGLLNDPSLPAAITPAVASSGAVGWGGKTTEEIYNDVLRLYRELAVNSRGLISPRDPLTLALTNEDAVLLGTANQFNINVTDMLNKYFGSLKIVAVPELTGADGVRKAFLFAQTVNGKAVGDMVYGQKYRQLQVIPDLSSYRQKVYASTFGCVVKYPLAFAIMTGLEAA